MVNLSLFKNFLVMCLSHVVLIWTMLSVTCKDNAILNWKISRKQHASTLCEFGKCEWMLNVITQFISIMLWLLWIEMANKPVPVGIIRTRPRFDGESPLWLGMGMGMGMGMGNTQNFQLGMGMGMGIYIYPPKYPSPLKLLNYL